jgi:hypothetical protein
MRRKYTIYHTPSPNIIQGTDTNICGFSKEK